MKRVSLLCAVAAAALMVGSAKADVFAFSFNGGPVGFSGGGLFEATNDGGGEFTIDQVLSGSVTDPFLGTSSITGISTFGGADNTLTFPSTTYFDDYGFSFDLADGLSINLFYDGVTDNALRSDNDAEIVTLSVASTPEPSSFVLLGSAALLGAGDLLRRRRSVA